MESFSIPMNEVVENPVLRNIVLHCFVLKQLNRRFCMREVDVMGRVRSSIPIYL